MATARVNGLDLFYYDDDFSDPWKPTGTIFMLHGFGRNANFWRAWVPTLGRHFRVIRADMRGCGQSAGPGPEAEFDIADVVSDCVGLFDALRADAVHYIGDATGGIVGVLLAANHPERIRSLTLISTPTDPARADPTIAKVGFASPAMAMQTLGMKAFWLSGFGTPEPGDPARAEYFAQEVARTPVHWAVSMWNFMHGGGADTTSSLSRISAPTLVISPTRFGSSSVTPDQQREMVRRIPNAKGLSFDGHVADLFCSRPDELARVALEFIEAAPVPDRSG